MWAMKRLLTIFPLWLCLAAVSAGITLRARASDIQFDFYGEAVRFEFDRSQLVSYKMPISRESIQDFYDQLPVTAYQPILRALADYREKHRPDDWLFYQLIRKTVQQVSPKAEDYKRYTLYKWFLLTSSGFDAILTYAGDRLLFYVHSDENIYNIPNRLQDGKQYVCLNYHDYPGVDPEKTFFSCISFPVPGAVNGFSYRITQLPEFHAADYMEKDLRFTYYQSDYHFKVRLNPQVGAIFANYPVVDYASYFNIPLSNETYRSLIPSLKKSVKGMTTRNGVDYLMRFTRYAFLFEADSVAFGGEKRLSPEQTLLYDRSDCDDRAALFFYLVKEIYNLPMIVVVFPQHVTIAVKFQKAIGRTIVYNGEKYSVCEPTPQKEDLPIGQLSPALRSAAYEIPYAYQPAN